MDWSKLIPSMFHRRLVLLLLATSIPVAGIVAQLGRLTLADGDGLRADAERRLVRTSWTPTTRGRILDRTGRVLARDVPSYDISVDYRCISGAWALSRAGGYARARHRNEWPKLDTEQRAELIDRYVGEFAAHIDRMWVRVAEVAGVDADLVDDQLVAIIERVESVHDAVSSRRLDTLRARRLARGQELTTEVEEQLERSASRPVREQVEPHAVLRRVQDDIGFAFLKLSEERVVFESLRHDGVPDEYCTAPLLPGLVVADAGSRVYPFEQMTVDIDLSTLPRPIRGEGTTSITCNGVATQLIGWMKLAAQQEDVERRRTRIANDQAFAESVLAGRKTDRGRYRDGDTAGASGIESALENELRGLRGFDSVALDTGAVEREVSSPGRDIRLTLDVMLQARVQAAMDPALGLSLVQEWHGEPTEWMPIGTTINGAAIVLEIDTGEILAMVSAPTFSRTRLRDDPDSIFKDPVALPYINRAIDVPYQPGSIVKPMVLATAVSHHGHDLLEGIDCHGHLFPDRDDVFRCWPYRERYGYSTHNQRLGHAPQAVEAIMASCNVYFYTLGQRLGVDGMADVYRLFGVDEPTEFGHDGLIGPNGDTGALEATDAIFMAIGQGPVAWTPLQAAEAYATLARGGVRIKPRLIDDGRPPEVVDLELDPEAVDAALLGIRRAVNEFQGTGHHITAGGRYEPIFNAEGVEVWGKTGTAQASSITETIESQDAEGDMVKRRVVLRSGDHSWFLVLVGPKGRGPKYAIAVVMEYAGSGGKVSGPIVNQIIHALKSEGYL